MIETRSLGIWVKEGMQVDWDQIIQLQHDQDRKEFQRVLLALLTQVPLHIEIEFMV